MTQYGAEADAGIGPVKKERRHTNRQSLPYARNPQADSSRRHQDDVGTPGGSRGVIYSTIATPLRVAAATARFAAPWVRRIWGASDDADQPDEVDGDRESEVPEEQRTENDNEAPQLEPERPEPQIASRPTSTPPPAPASPSIPTDPIMDALQAKSKKLSAAEFQTYLRGLKDFISEDGVENGQTVPVAQPSPPPPVQPAEEAVDVVEQETPYASVHALMQRGYATRRRVGPYQGNAARPSALTPRMNKQDTARTKALAGLTSERPSARNPPQFMTPQPVQRRMDPPPPSAAPSAILPPRQWTPTPKRPPGSSLKRARASDATHNF
eukprot:CAMPEP_0118953912 /NCGR_PEP_ID=MMETSP1169-20130426/57367_1 /TAXON_ID=36882 /ORGANISM="Pyramimonas obovata, Strain CCMP722" /LENGTH=325 /DNA_ID=CAMNT_0006901463 /DNA_START=32 /DNA_END=1006 /DNA_ORIENTATION=+